MINAIDKNMAYIASVIVTVLITSCGQNDSHPADYVNPFIGASTNTEKAGASHGLGKTFPGAATPFGLVQLSPNTITGGDNGPGYSYEHTTIEGFAFTQMSGIGWYGDLGNFLVMPATGELKPFSGKEDRPEKGYRSRYSKSSEKASAGYYGVTLTDYEIKAEMTAAPHSGIMRFTFPGNKQSRIQIDLARRVGGTSTSQYIKIINENTIKGWMKCTPDGGGWGNGSGKADYTVYFYAQFSKPFTKTGIWSADIPDSCGRKREDIESESYQKRIADALVSYDLKEMLGKHLGFFTEFETSDQEEVMLRSGISFVSMDGAEKNLRAEISDWDFDKVHNQAVKLWNEALGKIKIEGGTDDEKTIFYTALYHSMIDPRAFSDVDGSYPGGDGHIHHSPTFTKRTIFSGWDVFRSQFPLQTIINPVMVNDMINSLISLAEEKDSSYLERWEFLNAYSGCMIGSPAVSVIADSFVKGIRDYNVSNAYMYSKQTVDKFGNGEKGFSEGISRTLENAYSEWCLSRLSHYLNKPDDESVYSSRAQSYKNIFDNSVMWFRQKNSDGSWGEWSEKGRTAQGYGCVESNPYQQGWFVPHDIQGMSDLMGGKEKVIEDLISFFENAPKNMLWNDYYNHANEPVHHIPFLFNRLGAPWLTQKWTREICANAYHNSVEGLVGNEDVGQMSAWYVLAASGIHPVCPGETRFEITSPVFNKITFKTASKYASGRTFTITSINNSSENIYIQAAEMNGKPYSKCYIDFDDIKKGGELVLHMGDQPNKNWGIE